MTLTRWAALILLIASALTLSLARASELLPGIVPCPLCLIQRWPWRIALVASILALVMSARKLMLVFIAIGLLALASGVGIAALHVGVERGWWPSPLPACTAMRALSGLSVDDMLASLPSAPAKPCDEPTYVFSWLPITMAEANLGWSIIASFLVLLILGRARMSKT